jgi:SAM-dependent methyltransferase
MPRFASFDQRNYRTVAPREGYARWAETYEDTIKHDMDTWLLEELRTVAWNSVEHCADLGCGTGRTAAWLVSKGVGPIDGVDATQEMLERARGRNVFASLHLADVSDTGLSAAAYDLVITCLVDEHLAELGPLFSEAARLARDGGAFVLVGFHPFFIMATGMPTHFKEADGEPLAIETHVHLFSDHVTAALAAGWRLAELREQVIDDRWVRTKPSWAAHRDVPISFACVWRR